MLTDPIGLLDLTSNFRQGWKRLARLNGEVQYRWSPSSLVQWYNLSLFCRTSYLNEELKCIKHFHRAIAPWANILAFFWHEEKKLYETDFSSFFKLIEYIYKYIDGATTPSITTFSVTAPNIKALSITISKWNTQHNETQNNEA